MSGKLAILRERLQALQAKRAVVRWGEAACALALVMIAGWASAFVLDWTLRLPFLVRALMLLGWLAATAWAVRRFVWLAVKQQETVEDLALIVERRHQIDSDLIGALQFESATATTAAAWGSPRLTSAVIDYVAEFSPSLDVFQGFTYEQLPRRLKMLGAALLVALITAVVLPAEVGAFWNRFWLGAARYPSKTVISELLVNQQPISVVADGKSRTLSLPQGTLMTLTAVCRGEIPPRGHVRLESTGDGAATEFELKAAGPDQPGRFIAEHALPASDFTLQAFAGDTWSDPLTIRVVPLPVVDAVWTVAPPDYAASSDQPEPNAAARYLSVLEGSRLQLQVRGTNKQLAKVELHWDGVVIPLVKPASADVGWTLPADSPLSSVRSSGGYEIHAEDVDGLLLTPPIAGSIRLKPDRPPRVISGVLTKLVMPTAKPKLVFAATDDFGIGEIRLEIEVQREQGESQTQTKSLLKASAKATLSAVVRDEVRIDLTPYKLEKGDELRLTVEAVDARGGLEPKSGRSEPLVLKVTDKSGILAGLNESDQVTVKQLDAIIQRELGIGGDKR